MDLSTEIRSDLREKISDTYESENYKNSILEAMHFLTNLLRDKSNIDSDGTKLVNEVFSIKSPKLKINKNQTQSELDEQEGYYYLLTGLYKGIRNPRSHEIIQDTKETADSIIILINFLINRIDSSIATFTVDTFLDKVFDPDFVEKLEYADELVNEIPKKKVLEVLLDIYKKKNNGKSSKLKFMTNKIIPSLNEKDLESFLGIVSDELQIVKDEHSVIATMALIPHEFWPKLKKAARMRIENKIIASIQEGEMILSSHKLRDGKNVLGTWAAFGLVQHFTLKNELTTVLLAKLKDGDIEDNLFALWYYLDDLPSLINRPMSIKICVEAMLRVLRAGEIELLNKVASFAQSGSDEWANVFVDVFSEYTDPDNPEFYLRNGQPFLGKPISTIDEEEIPF